MASRLLIDFLVKPRCKNKTMLLYMKEGEIRSSPKTLLCLAVLFLRHYLHLTPAYAFILVFYIYLLPVLTTGPFWGSSFAVNRQLCMDDWWKNLLYIENLVEKDGRSCYGVTWYLANVRINTSSSSDVIMVPIVDNSPLDSFSTLSETGIAYLFL